MKRSYHRTTTAKAIRQVEASPTDIEDLADWIVEGVAIAFWIALFGFVLLIPTGKKK